MKQRNESKHKLWSVPRIWPESTVAIFASGPSLTLEDVLKCRPLRCIAINTSYKMAPWADCLYAADAKWWDHYTDAQDFAGLKISITKKNNPNIHAIGVAGRAGLSEERDKVFTGGNGGYQAIGLAYLFGASNIILLGYDMRWVEGKPYWHDPHPPKLSPSRETAYQKSFLPHFKTLAAELKTRGVNVYNCTPDSALRDFPMVSLYDAFDRIHNRSYQIRGRQT
jgi:hypothetical protein